MLLEDIKIAQVEHKFHLWAYVLMPNHVHLLIWPLETEYCVSKILGFKGRMAVRYSKLLLEQSPKKHKSYCVIERKQSVFAFWQRGGGHDRNICKPDGVWPVIRYIEQNPVRKGLVPFAKQWRWSSAYPAKATEEFRPKVDRSSIPVKMVNRV